MRWTRLQTPIGVHRTSGVLQAACGLSSGDSPGAHSMPEAKKCSDKNKKRWEANPDEKMRRRDVAFKSRGLSFSTLVCLKNILNETDGDTSRETIREKIRPI